MSSYLNFYVIPKEENDEKKKPVFLTSFSRSNELYSIFYDNLHIAFIGDEKEKYTELSSVVINSLLSNADHSINNISKRIIELEKHAAGNMEIISEILDLREYLEELKENRNYVQFIDFMARDSKICCNID